MISQAPTYININFFYVCEYFDCMDLVHHMHAVSKETRREHQISGAGVADGCEVTFGSWESNPGPL